MRLSGPRSIRMSSRTRWVAAAILTLAVTASARSVHAASIGIVGPGAFNANTATMDAGLGLTGKTIENFEDTTLIAGLSIVYDYLDPVADVGPITTLPHLWAPGASCGSVWDGTHALVNTKENSCWATVGLPSIPSTMTFNVGGVDFFGIGLSDFQTNVVDHAVLVNGVQVGILEDYANLVSTFPGRNGYLKIQADPGEAIYSVGFKLLYDRVPSNTNTQGQGRPIDGLVFDHLALGAPVTTAPAPVSEPASLGLMGLGLLVFSRARRRFRTQRSSLRR